ncbi:MAG: ketopantoate reductase C-terminal domain-containing protein [Pseudomonadota bacterium]
MFRALDPAGDAFAQSAAVDVAGFTLSHTDEADQIIWQKAAFNCAMNACAGLTGARVGLLNDGPGMVDLLHEVVAEVITVAQAQGIEADEGAVREQVAHALAHHTEHKPSMLQDLEAGRGTEIDSLCGEVARQAAAAGLRAPLNAALASLITLKSHAASAAS